MIEITEEEAFNLAEGATDFPIIVKEEDDVTESAVCLRKFPTGYVLGVSCDTKNLFRLFFSEDFEIIYQKCQNYLVVLREKGIPFDNMKLDKKH